MLGLWGTRSLLKYITTQLANYLMMKNQNGCQITKCSENLAVIEAKDSFVLVLPLKDGHQTSHTVSIGCLEQHIKTTKKYRYCINVQFALIQDDNHASFVSYM